MNIIYYVPPFLKITIKKGTETMERKDFSYEIQKYIGTIETNGVYSKEVTLICWRDQKTPKLDIRMWKDFSSEHERKPLKGISLDGTEAETLKELLNNA